MVQFGTRSPQQLSGRTTPILYPSPSQLDRRLCSVQTKRSEYCPTRTQMQARIMSACQEDLGLYGSSSTLCSHYLALRHPHCRGVTCFPVKSARVCPYVAASACYDATVWCSILCLAAKALTCSAHFFETGLPHPNGCNACHEHARTCTIFSLP